MSEVIEVQIIKRIIEMKNGTKNTTPQPDAARAELAYFNELFKPFGVNLNAAVALALKETA